jgi:hypothetical protein
MRGRQEGTAAMGWARVLTAAAIALSIVEPTSAQHAAFRIKGKVKTESGEPIANADIRAEAFYGYGAGTFAGQRTFTAQSNNKGEWSIGALQPGVWLFEVLAVGYLPESVILPPRILAVSQGTSGMSMTWDLILKPVRPPSGERGAVLMAAVDAARKGEPDIARSAILNVPNDTDADYLAAAGRVAILTRNMPIAATLFKRAVEIDPSSYRATLGLASIFLFERDFDSASRAFDAARNRTRDKDEQKFISAAIGELAAIKYR